MMSAVDYLKKYGFSDCESKEIASVFKTENVRKKEAVIDVDESLNQIFLITKGIARGVYLDKEGREFTKCFATEGMWCGVYNYIKRTPYEYRIEAIEDMTLEAISVNDLEVIFHKIKKSKRVFEQLCMEAFMKEEQRNYQLLMLNAEERYRKFAEDFPELVRRVKQEYIASYIGVTPSSLCRALNGKK